jgi:hypothetical protein
MVVIPTPSNLGKAACGIQRAGGCIIDRHFEDDAFDASPLGL